MELKWIPTFLRALISISLFSLTDERFLDWKFEIPNNSKSITQKTSNGANNARYRIEVTQPSIQKQKL